MGIQTLKSSSMVVTQKALKSIGVIRRRVSMPGIHFNRSSMNVRTSDRLHCPLTRRAFLRMASLVGAGTLVSTRNCFGQEASKASAKSESQRYKIAVCDWMILKRQKLGAIQLSREIGADGVEVDMGSLGERETFDNQLAQPEMRKQFLDKAREVNLEICSLAMSGFYAQSFAERPTVPRMLQDCLETMKLMGVKTAFLPLGVRGDLVKHPELRPAIVSRLKAVAPLAEQAKLTIGLETAL